MAKTVVLDELLLTVRVPADLPDAEVDAVRRALESDEFVARLRRAVRTVLVAFPDLAPVRVTLSQ